jgi:type VI secretion system secreted protein Hcp
MRRFAVCIALLTACVLAQGQAAADDIFGKFTGIAGESTAEGRKDWIDVLSYSFGASNPASFASGGGGSQGKVDFSDFHFVKTVDKSSPALLLNLASGKHFQEALFDVVQSGGQPQQPFLQYKFSDVLITSYNASGAGGGGVLESLSFAFSKVEMTYRPQDGKGGFGAPVTMFWDVAKNTGGLNTAPIPEPSTWAMLMAGLLCVVYFGRNRVRGRELAT